MKLNDQLSPFLNITTETLDGSFMIAEALEGQFFIKIWSKRLPEGKIFKIWLQTTNGFILLDNEDEFWHYTALLKKPLQKHRLFALKCSRYCGIKRFSIQCLFSCRKRRIFNGESCNPVRIGLRFNPLYKDRRIGALRMFIIDKLRSMERVLNYG